MICITAILSEVLLTVTSPIPTKACEGKKLRFLFDKNDARINIFFPQTSAHEALTSHGANNEHDVYNLIAVHMTPKVSIVNK